MMYLLIQPDEDGNPLRWITQEQVQDIKQLMEDYGISNWLYDDPITDPNYWGEGNAMLLSVNVLKIIPVETVTKYEIAGER